MTSPSGFCYLLWLRQTLAFLHFCDVESRHQVRRKVKKMKRLIEWNQPGRRSQVSVMAFAILKIFELRKLMTTRNAIHQLSLMVIHTMRTLVWTGKNFPLPSCLFSSSPMESLNLGSLLSFSNLEEIFLWLSLREGGGRRSML